MIPYAHRRAKTGSGSGSSIGSEGRQPEGRNQLRVGRSAIVSDGGEGGRVRMVESRDAKHLVTGQIKQDCQIRSDG